MVSYLPSFVSNLPKNIYTAASQQIQALPKNENGENLADLWVKFLLAEVKSVNEAHSLANEIEAAVPSTPTNSLNSLVAASPAVSDSHLIASVQNASAELVKDIKEVTNLPTVNDSSAASLDIEAPPAPRSYEPHVVDKTKNMATYSYPPSMFQ